jgi:eukaryotic-like serine/threonine-protein kinase
MGREFSSSGASTTGVRVARTTLRDELAPGASIGGFLIEGFLASGGWGSVHLATRISDGRSAAIKVLHRDLAATPQSLRHFAREVAILQRLHHPHIVELYDIGALPDGTPFYVMEYLSGKTLDQMLTMSGRFSVEETLDLMVPVCMALQAAHEEGIVHRDVKASNIVIAGEDPATLKLLDFGIAKLVSPDGGGAGQSSSLSQLGTPSIMAPEQILGYPVDARADVYALGILVYRCITGRRPFEAEQTLDLIRQHIEEPVRPPSQRVLLRPAVDAVVVRCLEKSPDDRFDSVRSFLRAFREAVGERPRRLTSSIPQPGMAVAIYIEARVKTVGDEIDEALADEIGGVLDLAEEELRDAGFTPAIVTSTEILGIRVLPEDPSGCVLVRRSALSFALSLRDRLAGDPAAAPRVHVNVTVHHDGVLVRQGPRPEFFGGALLRTHDWAPSAELQAVCATTEAIRGLDDFATEPGPARCALVVGWRRSSDVCPREAPTLSNAGVPAVTAR